jgi:two-component system chemotaxis sensor kinase CheA
VQLARRLGKGELDVEIDDAGVRLNPDRWAPLWSTIVHAVVNAVDHGIESPEERTRAGKGRPRLALSARQADRQLVIAVADDGRGVDWESIRRRARERGLPCDSPRDLVSAMFATGVSTRDVATETSGRGIGLSALDDAVRSLHGTIDVISKPGHGMRLELRFVLDDELDARMPKTRRPDDEVLQERPA